MTRAGALAGARWPGLLPSLLAVGWTVFPACTPTPRLAAAQELADLSSAVDAVRRASNSRKASLLTALREISCRNFCDLKNKCVEAYAVHLDSLRQIELARAQLAQGAKEDAHRMLDRAQARLDQARELTGACAGAEGEARRSLSSMD